MSAQPPPLPFSITELKDKRTIGLNRLVTLLVSALASNDPQGIIAAISTFVRYFTSVLEVLEKIANQRNNSRASGIPFTWTYPVILTKRLPKTTMDVPQFRKVYHTRQLEQIQQKIHLLIVQLVVALNANSPAGKEEADRVTLDLLREIEKLPPQ